jgi:hypothetical protein
LLEPFPPADERRPAGDAGGAEAAGVLPCSGSRPVHPSGR